MTRNIRRSPIVRTGEWIYDTFTTPSGEAWMGGSSGRLLHSSDFGHTWSTRSVPFGEEKRVYRIFMTADRGIVSEDVDALALTSDRGRTWRSIPTPLDQHRIDAVGIFADFLLVQQNERVFASRFAPISWSPVAELVAIAVQRDGARAFGIDAHGAFVALDTALAPTPIPGARIQERVASLRAEAGVLYAIDEASALYRADATGARFAAPMTDGDPSAAIASVRRAGERLFGIATHGVYASDDGGWTFDRIIGRPGSVFGLEPRSARELFVWGSEGAAIVDSRRARNVR